MHGKAVQLGRGASRMLRSSPMVGTRQSQCPAKQSVAVPSLGVFRSFSLSRKSEYSVPVGSVKGVAALHVYVLFTSCGSGHSAPQTTTAPGVPVFFSHISPVWLSQIARSPTSVKRVGGFAGHATAAAPPAAGVPPPPPPPSPQAVSASRIDRPIIDATILSGFMFSDVSWSFPHSLGAAVPKSTGDWLSPISLGPSKVLVSLPYRIASWPKPRGSCPKPHGCIVRPVTPSPSQVQILPGMRRERPIGNIDHFSCRFGIRERSNMDLRHARTFVTVADLGTVSKAAERLHIAQPALSRQIGNIEEE